VTQAFNANGHLTVKTVTPEDTSPAGLQAGKQSQRYTYSVSERLLRISDGSNANNGQGSEIARYSYDPFGRRIAKTVSQNTSGQGSTGTTLYFYADEGLIAEVDGSPTNNGGNITTTYGWMPNNTWGTAPQWKRDHAGQSGATDVQGSANTNGITHYVHVDHLGTSQRLTNAQGETTWRAVSEAFGKTFVDTTVGLKGPGSIYFRASMHSCPAAPAFTLMACRCTSCSEATTVSLVSSAKTTTTAIFTGLAKR
jgi:uncharacterized protein RhaS with RHS repeats